MKIINMKTMNTYKIKSISFSKNLRSIYYKLYKHLNPKKFSPWEYNYD